MSDLNVIYRIAADISGLKSGVDRAAKATEGLETSVARLGKLFTAKLAVEAAQAVLQLGKQVIDFASNLEDLSAQTGISTTGLQKFDLAFSEAGVTMETVASASAKLANNLIGGDKSTVAALEKLGLSVKDLKTLKPEDQFVKVGDAIGGIKNPTERAYAAMQVFGKGGAELLKGLDGNLAETIANFEELGLVVDEETIKQIDAFGDSMGVLGKQILAVTADALGPLMPMLGQFLQALVPLAKLVGETLALAFKALGSVIIGLGVGIEMFIATVLEGIAKIPGATRVFGDLSGAAAALRADAQKGHEALTALWQSTDHVGESATQATPPLIGLGAAMGDTEARAKALKKAQEEYAALLDDSVSTLTQYDRLVAQLGQTTYDGIAYDHARGISTESLAVHYNVTRAAVEQVIAVEKALVSQTDATIRSIQASMATGAAAVANLPGLDGLTALMRQMAQAQGTLRLAATQSFVGFAPLIGGDAGMRSADAFGSQFKERLGSVLSGGNIGNLIVQSLTGGGGFKGAMQALASQVGGTLTQALGGGLTKAIGGSLGKMVGGLIGPLGALAGPLIDKIGGFFKNLFGGKQKETNRIREDFVQLNGGLGELNEKAARAGATLTAMLNAKTPEAYKRAIDDLNKALSFQDEAMETLDATVKKYGFTIQELGPAFARQELHKKAQELYQDFQVLAAAGVPIDAIIRKMGTSMNEFVQNAIKTGTEVPEAMRPMIQAMIDNGELVDENGEKYASLEDTGLSFSKTMTQGFNELIKTVDRLTEAIARGLGIALENLPEETNVDVNVNTHYNTDTSGAEPPPTPETPNLPYTPEYAATGGVVTTSGLRSVRWPSIGADVVPTMLTPGEVVLTEAQTSQLASALQANTAALQSTGGGAGGNMTLVVNIDGVFSEGDLVSTIQRRVVPIIHDTWNTNVAGTRTQARDVLGVA